MKLVNDGYELVAVDSVQEHPENPRVGDEKEIAASIAHNGFYGACVVQRSTKYIIVGNHRFRQLKAAGAELIPVIFVDVDDQRAVQIMLADNRSRDMAGGQVDSDRLMESLTVLTDDAGGIAGTGYIEATLHRLREEANVPPPPPEDDDDGSAPLESKVCTVNLGPLRFRISKNSYDTWIAKKMKENSFNIKAVAKSLRLDLKLKGD